MASIFSQIVEGKIPCYKIAEDEHHLAFLDINPLAMGHTLVIPKKEVDYVFDIEDDAYLALFAFSKRVAAAIEKNVTCERIGVSVIGLEVPHAHVHLVPINKIHDLDFTKKRVELSQEAFSNLASEIASSFL